MNFDHLESSVHQLLQPGLSKSLLPQLRKQPELIEQTAIPGIPCLTPLFLAVLGNDVVFLKALLKLGAKPRLPPNEGDYQPLHLAARMDSHLVIPTLVQAGCRMDEVTLSQVGEASTTPLLVAAHFGNLRSIKALSECPGFSLPSVPLRDMQSLNAAVRKGNFLAVRFLAKLGCDVNYTTRESNLIVPIHTAARYNHPGVVRELLSLHGIRPYKKDIQGWTALTYASRYGSADVVPVLVQAGLSPYPESLQDAINPLFIAIVNGELNTVKQLVNSALQYNCLVPEFWSDYFLIHFALMARNILKHTKIPSVLSPKPTQKTLSFRINDVEFEQTMTIACKSTSQDSRFITDRVSVHFLREVVTLSSGLMCPEPKTGMLPIHGAAWMDDPEALRLFIDLGCPKHAFMRPRKNGYRATPMEVAASRDSVNAIKALVAAGCDVEFHHPFHGTPLVTAVATGSTKAAEVLLQLRANPNAETFPGLLPIQIAAACGLVDMIEVLAKYDANIHVGYSKHPTETMKQIIHRNKTELYPLVKNYQGSTLISPLKSYEDVTSIHERAMRKLFRVWLDEYGFIYPPLMMAIEGQHRNAVKKLLELGCDPNTRVFSADALRHACEFGSSDIVSDLIDSRADVEWIDPNGDRVIDSAILCKKPDVVSTLINKGCDVVSFNHSVGVTPFQRACVHSQPSIASILSTVVPDVHQCAMHNLSPLHLVLLQPRLQMKHADGTVSSCPVDVDPDLRMETVELLLKLGCSVNAIEEAGLTPLDLALHHKLKKIVLVLTEAGALKGTKITEKAALEERVQYLEEHLGQVLSAEARTKSLDDNLAEPDQYLHRLKMFSAGSRSSHYSEC